MGRLIDADALIEEIKNKMSQGSARGVFLAFVDDIPTAYDVEKVVEELEEKLTCDDFGTCNYCQYRWCSMELLEADDAIDIVRKGGAE